MSSRTGNIKVKCKTCGKEFLAYQYLIDHGRAKFCSKECYYESIKVLQVSELPTAKTCSRCGKSKPISEFGQNKGNKSLGLNSTCKTCNSERAGRYYHKDKENKCKQRCDFAKVDRKRNPEKYANRYKRWHDSIWNEALAFFGPCACCGEDRLEFLSIDHINGHGNQIRKKTKKVGRILLLELHSLGWPEVAKKEFRILCMNCNFAIGHYGYCPHHPEKKFTFWSSKTRQWEIPDDR